MRAQGELYDCRDTDSFGRVNEVQMHVVSGPGEYVIKSIYISNGGKEMTVPGVAAEAETGSPRSPPSGS